MNPVLNSALELANRFKCADVCSMKIYVKSSPQHGRGVFAKQAIPSGEIIMTFTGPVLGKAEVQEDQYHLQIDEQLYLGASGAEDDYVNHSCAPNAGFREGLVLVARRLIDPDEEITWDYSSAIDEEDFPGFPCACRSPFCRGTVRSFRHLDPMQQEYLRPWLLPYLVKKYFSQGTINNRR